MRLDKSHHFSKSTCKCHKGVERALQNFKVCHKWRSRQLSSLAENSVLSWLKVSGSSLPAQLKRQWRKRQSGTAVGLCPASLFLFSLVVLQSLTLVKRWQGDHEEIMVDE